MIKWLQRWWWARQRATDLRILWPTCCELAAKDTKNLDDHWVDKAKAAFAVHCFNDPAWVRHYEGDLFKVIDRLVPPWYGPGHGD
jgi:hypothetical protein